MNPPRQPVRILVLPGSLDGANLGDVAMLEMALERLSRLWPTAHFTIVSVSQAVARGFLPAADFVSWNACKAWTADRRGSWKRLLPDRAVKASVFAGALFNSDLVVLTGSGVLTDAFEPTALRILETFNGAIERGIPTAILGQGIGPVKSSALLSAARELLPRVGCILVREPASGQWLREQCGVAAEKVRVTGDDAIELAWRLRPARPDSCLGINLRVASYSGVDGRTLDTVRDVSRRMSGKLPAPLLGIPITRCENDSDLRTLERLLPADTGVTVMPWTTAAAVERVGRCRVVIAGSYHAAVFALAQGSPVVAVAQSDYYFRKFEGLARQFGGGCRILAIDDADFAERLAQAIEETWTSAPGYRDALLASAERQMAAGREAYGALPERLSIEGAENNR